MTPLCWWWISVALATNPEEASEEAPVEQVGPDRSAPPPVLAPSLREYAEPERVTIADGVELAVLRVPGVRKVAMQVIPQTGTAEATGGTWPLSAAAWLADAATLTHDAKEFSALQDLHDARVYAFAQSHNGGLGLVVPRESLDVGLDLLSGVVREPRFPKVEVKKYISNRVLGWTVRGPRSPESVAEALLGYGTYPSGHPYGPRPDLGVTKSLTPGLLDEAYGDWLRGSPILVLVAGDVSVDEVREPVSAMLQGFGAAGELPPMAPAPVTSRVLTTAMEGQEQVSLRLRLPAPPRTHDDHVAAWAAQFVLGGHFLSRLNANLREEKGWTYGTRASYARWEEGGLLTVSIDVDAGNAAAAVREIEGELQRLVHEPPDADELALAYRTHAQSWNTAQVAAEEALGWAMEAVERRTTLQGLRTTVAALDGVSPEQVAEVAQRWWGPEAPRLWVLVGEGAAVDAAVAELGWEAERVSPTDAVLGKF